MTMPVFIVGCEKMPLTVSELRDQECAKTPCGTAKIVRFYGRLARGGYRIYSSTEFEGIVIEQSKEEGGED